MKIPNTIIQRYRDKTGWTQAAIRRDPFHRLQESEELFKKYGAQYGFDWLLLASFAYQESGLDQRARSAAGVGAEPVQYVRNIYQYYIAYKRVPAESEERKNARKAIFD